MRLSTLAVGGLLAFVSGCGGSALSKDGSLPAGTGSGQRAPGGVEVTKEAAASFEQGTKAFDDHDKAFDWDETKCRGVAGMFQKAGEAQKSVTDKSFPSAHYNAGLAFQRCGLDAEARKEFQEALSTHAGFHRAAAQLALYEYKDSGNIDQAISKLWQIVQDAKFQNVEALVSVAALQMERGNDSSDSDGPNDLARALKNIQRALAIDDGYMPAFNQLAIYYMELAKKKAEGSSKHRRGGLVVAGAEGVAVNQQMLDLASLVASQAVRKNPKYAAIQNTAGLIQVAERNYNSAVKSFGRARELDPRFFEAQMNYAAVNLAFRGFKAAETAYREALKLRPNEYEAHLGLALALRGQISPANWDGAINEAQQHLDVCKKIAPDRAETYYNEAILTQEYKSKAGSEEVAIPILRKAAEIYRTFVSKAGSDESFKQAVKRAQDRSQDIEDTIKFIEQGVEMRKQEEAAQKAAKAAPPPKPAAPAAPAAAAPPAAK